MNAELRTPPAHTNDPSGDDFARVVINTPFDKPWLEKFLEDPQRLLRINSLFEFTSFENTGDQCWHMVAKNLSNEHLFDVTFDARTMTSGILLTYKGWLKASTKISIEQDTKKNCRLIIIDDYSGTDPKEREQRIAEVDNTIIQWGNDIYRYLRQWKRWAWVPGWKAYMLRFWQGMKPSARRISFMLIAITVAEFILFLFVFMIFWLELPGSL